MRDRRPAGNMLWAVLFFFAATFSFTGCGGSIDNAPTDANLSNLTVSPGALQPAFSGDITDYTVDVATSVTSVTVTAQPQDAQATVKINNLTTKSRVIPLGEAGSSKLISIAVTSFNGNLKIYLVTVTRTALEGNNNLQSLTVSPGALIPSFTASRLVYTVNVATTVTQVTVVATKSDPNAVMSGSITAGAGQATGEATIQLPGGPSSTPVSITVTAPNGNQKTYTVTVNRGAPANNNNNLSALAVSAGTLFPGFSPGNLSYNVSALNTTLTTTVTATVADSTATLTINGSAAISGIAAGPIALAVGANPIPIVVTAQDGTPKTYTVTVNRAAPLSGNNDLSALDVSAGALVPPFDPGTTSYSITVPHATKDTTVTATVADSTATLTINGSPATSGVPSASIPLDVGPNSILIVVTAQNGTPNPYTVLITRERKSSPEK